MNIKNKLWHSMSLENIKDFFETDLYAGLSDDAVIALRKQYGKNILSKKYNIGILGLVLKQFKSPLVFILLAAGVVTFFLKEYVDTIVIFIALFINVLIGTFQEERAGRAFEKLSESRQKYATVIRNNARMVISANDLVVGDIVIVDAGMHIPADARLIDVNELGVNESVLTGEWIEVKKEIKSIAGTAPLTDRVNMIWAGTFATSGTCKAVVVAVGKNTQIGTIADTLSESNTATPLQKSISNLARYITYAILVALVLIFAIGLFRGMPIQELLLVSIAIAVAALPEGLPAALTVVLALGMESILKKRGLVRNLLAAETLGSTTVILTDKTGTLTMAEMSVSSIITAGSTGKHNGDNGKEDFSADERDVLAMAVMVSGAFVEAYDEIEKKWIVRGVPVERAVVLAGLDAGLRQDTLLEHNRRLDIIAFESARRFAATLHVRNNGKSGNRVHIFGAPETLLNKADFVYENGKKKKITNTMREEFMRLQMEKAGEGKRVLAVGFIDKDWDMFPEDVKDSDSALFESIVFGGLVVIHDPIRKDVAKSIKEVRDAGAQVIMVTGDNVNTARRIAIEVGISSVSGEALLGSDIAEMTDKELLNALKKTKIFARVLPHQKMRIVKVLKASDEIVAMTGDGINDAPALHRADIGIALGSGTDVAKEASDMILLNNSFTVIVRAIEEGRRILDNIKKIVAYLLSTGFSEIFVVVIALLAGAPLPLLPAQILWTNIVGEGFMNFSFAFEPKEKGVMKRNPNAKSMRRIITPHLRSLIAIVSIVTGLSLVVLYFVLLRLDMSIEEVRTIMFTALSLNAIFFSFSIKDLSRPIWKINIFSNKYLIVALFLSIGILLLALFTPPLMNLLSLTPITLSDISFVLVIGVFNLLTIEIVKYVYFIRGKEHVHYDGITIR